MRNREREREKEKEREERVKANFSMCHFVPPSSNYLSENHNRNVHDFQRRVAKQEQEV